MAKLKFKPYSTKGTHKEKMTEEEKRNFSTKRWLDEVKKSERKQELARRNRELFGTPEVPKDSKIRDEAQKEINKKTALENYFETGEYKGKERHEGKGRWVTMKGRRVFIEDGENPTDALKKSLAWEKKNKRRASGVNKNNRDWNK